uniref:Ig-like domain-containing protein n=1 Tax=Chrysemys picta bellii TaxID=8478 RepID=A0A8C3FKL0_CHRPI
NVSHPPPPPYWVEWNCERFIPSDPPAPDISQLSVPWCHPPAEPPLTPHPPTHFPALSAGSQLSPFPTGIHTQQLHKSCALSDQAPVDPRFQFAYDGGDFISFDNQTGTWFPAVQVALVQKQRWEADKTWTQHVQSWLQYECPRRLQRLLQSGGKILEQGVWKSVPPEISVSRRDAPDGSATLSCRASGFYPRPIHVSWVRDGEDILAETGSSGILPNADGTYYTQSSLEISPQQDGHRYACRVEHSSLPEGSRACSTPSGESRTGQDSASTPRSARPSTSMGAYGTRYQRRNFLFRGSPSSP